MALQALVTVWPPSLQLNLAKKRDHGLGPLCTMPYPTNGLYLDLQRMLKSRLAAAGSGLCGSRSGEQVRLGIFNQSPFYDVPKPKRALFANAACTAKKGEASSTMNLSHLQSSKDSKSLIRPRALTASFCLGESTWTPSAIIIFQN